MAKDNSDTLNNLISKLVNMLPPDSPEHKTAKEIRKLHLRSQFEKSIFYKSLTDYDLLQIKAERYLMDWYENDLKPLENELRQRELLIEFCKIEHNSFLNELVADVLESYLYSEHPFPETKQALSKMKKGRQKKDFTDGDVIFLLIKTRNVSKTARLLDTCQKTIRNRVKNKKILDEIKTSDDGPTLSFIINHWKKSGEWEEYSEKWNNKLDLK